MRRDVFIENDSGGFSIVASDALDAIIADGRTDDERFVSGFKALLLELVGDDSMPVRIVVEEPLTSDEEAQWLARTSWRIDTSDGRIVVMGGFDPDIMQWWKDETDGARDGRGVALVEAAPGSWSVDVYAHAGSMNGRAILGDGDKPGAAFRRAHPDRAFPLWLAQMLEFSSDDDPGHEEVWRDVPASTRTGQLTVDTETAGVIGFLVHVTRASGAPANPPTGGWFDADTNRRTPTTFPLGLPASVPDPDLESFRDRLLGRTAPEPTLPDVSGVVEVIERWTGDPLKRLAGETPAITLDPADAYLLYWIAALSSDSPPRFELWVEPTGAWTAPPPTPEYGVVAKGLTTAIGPAPNAAGWSLWWAARAASRLLTNLPDRTTIDLAMAPRLDYNDELNPAIGRALYSGTVVGGRWQVAEVSPLVPRDALDAAIAFVRELVESGRLHVSGDAERQAFDDAAQVYSPEEGSLAWVGDRVSLTDPDERMLVMLAQPVFRMRFAGYWLMDSDS